MIRNPVLPGFHPDPSILRVGAEYYIATSTFEWYPGVRLHRSRDLVRWEALGGALDTQRLLDLAGVPDSGGVWAPNLSYADGLFHLVYSNVSTYTGGFTDAPNYLTTAPSIEGPWSDPVLLHARGFDASLFHDGAESWLVNMVHDWRPGHGGTAGLEVTRFDRRTRKTTGEPTPITLPPGETWVEGPNLYRRGPWYYLVTADGGTGYDHRVTVARSRPLTGPYERDPAGALITAKDHPDLPLQKAGHGSLVQADGDGSWYMTYLVARPHGRRGPCILGRETALTDITWSADGWPRTRTGLPESEIPEPGAHGGQSAGRSGNGIELAADLTYDLDDFDRPRLSPAWSTLRRPAGPEWLSLTERPSHLRLHGGRSPQSLTGASLVARRVTAPRCTFEAEIDYRPGGFQHLAGITAYYNTDNWYFLHVTADDHGDRVLGVAGCDRGSLTADEPGRHSLPGTGPVRLRAQLEDGTLRLSFDAGSGWQGIGTPLDATILSDEHAERIEDGHIRSLGFTGAFFGLWAWDLTGLGHPADFDLAAYRVDG